MAYIYWLFSSFIAIFNLCDYLLPFSSLHLQLLMVIPNQTSIEIVLKIQEMLMSLMATKLGDEHDLAEATARVFEELEKIPNMTMDDSLRVGSLIAYDQQKIHFFLSLPDHPRHAWVAMLLNGHI
uniref:Uncharacterized protein n=1 Tax=Davidia involucrata TaxID=16924 RepID=A0A5B7BXJ4_DAVIN